NKLFRLGYNKMATRVLERIWEVMYPSKVPPLGEPALLRYLCPNYHHSTSTQTMIDMVPDLPFYIWRNILNYYIYKFYRYNIKVDNQERANGLIIQELLDLCMVSKTWARHVIPFLDFGTYHVTSSESLRRLLGLVTTQAEESVPYSITAMKLDISSDLLYSINHRSRHTLLKSLTGMRQLKVSFGSINVEHNSPMLKLFHTSLQVLDLTRFTQDFTSYPTIFASLRGLSNLHTLNLGHNRIGPNIIDHLVPFIDERSSLTNLNLENNLLAHEGGVALFKLLARPNNIATLNLSFNLLMDSVQFLADTLLGDYDDLNMGARALRNLNLDENGIGEAGGMALAHIIAHCRGIRTLNIGNNRFEKASLNAIVAALTDNNTLSDITLSCYNNKMSGHLLAACIKSNTTLKHLNLMVNDLGAIGNELFRALEGNRSVTNLNLSYTKLKNNSKSEMERMLVSNTSITQLNLSYAFYDSDISCILRALTLNNTLTDLDLSLNSIEAAEGVLLGTMLRDNQSITHLNLSGNMLKSGVEDIIRALTSNKTLRSLVLRKNQVGTVTKRLLFNLISQNNVLTHLDLNQNLLDDQAGHEIACGLALNQTLLYLDLSCNKFQEASGESFIQTLSNNNSLRHIDLVGNLFGRYLSNELDQRYSFVHIENDKNGLKLKATVSTFAVTVGPAAPGGGVGGQPMGR
ncbi:hypothetical protein SAMD00019534_052310, partial [Acytostelium subglobosum LB1]|uniref:hypothetical protein n=1 Tax=Acytostelium subglobosum LB1 TaxID=1410327 RepID=UPI000644FF94